MSIDMRFYHVFVPKNRWAIGVFIQQSHATMDVNAPYNSLPINILIQMYMDSAFTTFQVHIEINFIFLLSESFTAMVTFKTTNALVVYIALISLQHLFEQKKREIFLASKCNNMCETFEWCIMITLIIFMLLQCVFYA